MQLHSFAIYDRKSQTYAVPFFFPTIAQGIRAFQATAKAPDTMLSQFPEDFELYQLGTFDDHTARLDSLEHPHFLCNATMTTDNVAPLKATKAS